MDVITARMGGDDMRLKGFFHLEGDVRLVTGLHIGAGKDDIKIGGVDTPVQKDPTTGEPVIPGSSLKGKLRTLLEWHWGLAGNNGGPWLSPQDIGPVEKGTNVLKIFGGLPKSDEPWEHGPGRLKVSDFRLAPVSRTNRGRSDWYEEKHEIAMDRTKGSALRRAKRTTERVVAGTVFSIDISFRVFDGDADSENLFGHVLSGLRLVSIDGLGGSTSRGYGRIAFERLRLVFRSIDGNGVLQEHDLTNEARWKEHLGTLGNLCQ